jgi:hypothetical protein
MMQAGQEEDSRMIFTVKRKLLPTSNISSSSIVGLRGDQER